MSFRYPEERERLHFGQAKRLRRHEQCTGEETAWQWLDIDVCVTRKPGTSTRPALSSPAAVGQFFYEAFPQAGASLEERFILACLDAKNRPIGIATIHVGSLSSTTVHPREVLRPAVMLPTSAIVVAHNHPTGDPTPSPEDKEITARLRAASKIIGIRMLDHVILVPEGDRVYSFATEKVELI